VPSLEAVRDQPDANYYSLLIVALLERGEPISLAAAAQRFAEAGIAPADRALASLKRCKPARAPIYRDGDLYALDPHDDEADLWVFRLGLRPARGRPSLQVVRPDPGPIPSPDLRLTVALLDEAFREGVPGGWSALRVAICVLDAHGAVMKPEDALAFVGARTQWNPLSADASNYWRRGAAIRVRDDGWWELDSGHDGVRSARRAVLERVEVLRRWAHQRPDPALIKANTLRFEREREAHAESLARMSRIIVHGFPPSRPEVVVLLDVTRREIATFMGDEIARVKQDLAGYDIIAGVEVRALLRNLNIDPGTRRLGELGPPQKTMQLNQRGRSLKITTSLLVQGSCGIHRPFGDPSVLQRYLREGKDSQLCRRLEADARSLFALYQYGRLHGTLRLRWGFLDERIPAPWVHRDETRLHQLMARAHQRGVPLEVVVGHAPGWAQPWSRVERAFVVQGDHSWQSWLLDEDRHQIELADVQLARLPGTE
jgi:hypothetical protein